MSYINTDDIIFPLEDFCKDGNEEGYISISDAKNAFLMGIAKTPEDERFKEKELIHKDIQDNIDGNEYYNCPNCGSLIVRAKGIEYNDKNFCESCGQKIKVKKEPNAEKCNKCGKILDEWDRQEDYSINRRLGYGIKYDCDTLKLKLCCHCMEELIDSCKISPIIERQ